MRLLRFGGGRTGIMLELPTGPGVLDVVASLGALSPEDPASIETLNDILKDGAGWGPLIQHWARVRVGLRQLAHIASITPDHPGLVVHRCAALDSMPKPTKDGEIVALGIAEDEGGFSYCAESSRDCEIASCVYSVRGGYQG
jgi:hypothetical protein